MCTAGSCWPSSRRDGLPRRFDTTHRLAICCGGDSMAGRRLGSRYILRGTLRRAGSEVRLNTELVETDHGTVVSSRFTNIPRELTFEGQDRVVAQVVNAIAPRVHEAELQRIRGRRPDSL